MVALASILSHSAANQFLWRAWSPRPSYEHMKGLAGSGPMVQLVQHPVSPTGQLGPLEEQQQSTELRASEEWKTIPAGSDLWSIWFSILSHSG